MRINVLFIEDDTDIINLTREMLQDEGIEVDVAMSVKFGIQKIKLNRPDVVLLDLMLPDGDGKEVVKWMKQSKEYSNIPVIVITAKSSEIDKVLLLELGADDYLTKPFSIKELIARIRALLRRYNSDNSKDFFIFDDLKINFDEMKVIVENEEIQFTKKEFQILEYLVRNKGIVLKREKILMAVWGLSDDNENSRSLDVHINNIRKKLGKYKSLIKTVKGVGYRFS
jgi:DNA-binding response OmpR family regulator